MPVAEPSPDGHDIIVSVLDINCSCGWASSVTDTKYAEPVSERHLIRMGLKELK